MSEDDGKLCSKHMCMHEKDRERKKSKEKNIACNASEHNNSNHEKVINPKSFQKHNCEIIFKSTMPLYNFTSSFPPSPHLIFLISRQPLPPPYFHHYKCKKVYSLQTLIPMRQTFLHFTHRRRIHIKKEKNIAIIIKENTCVIFS